MYKILFVTESFLCSTENRKGLQGFGHLFCFLLFFYDFLFSVEMKKLSVTNRKKTLKIPLI